MRRAVLMLGLAAGALPVPALADAPMTGDHPRHEAAVPAADEIPFSPGDVPCSLIPVRAAEESTPAGPGPCPGVRPGARVKSEIGDCTLNFLFRGPDGTRYVGTAGHCVSTGPPGRNESNPDGTGRVERVWSWGSGPVAENSDGDRIGEFAYAVLQASRDFSLIRLDPGVESSPEMCHFGTPRGVYKSRGSEAVVLQYYGNGFGTDTVAPARSALAMGTPNRDHVYAAGVALPGDSGAGVMTTDGLAVGVLVTTGLHGIRFEPGPYSTPQPRDLPQADAKGVDVGTVGITRLEPQLAQASEMLGVPLELMTAE